MPVVIERSSPAQPSQSLPKHPLYGLWNPDSQSWLKAGIDTVHTSELWTGQPAQAQIFRTLAFSASVTQYLCDEHNICTHVKVLNHAEPNRDPSSHG